MAESLVIHRPKAKEKSGFCGFQVHLSQVTIKEKITENALQRAEKA
jgi:hypothetical protein